MNEPIVWTKELIDQRARRDQMVRDLLVSADVIAEAMWPNQDSEDDDIIREEIINQKVVEFTVAMCIRHIMNDNRVTGFDPASLLHKFGLDVHAIADPSDDIPH